MAEQPGACLISAHDPEFMTEFFDHFPPAVRAILRDSKYDLCSACFKERVEGLMEEFNYWSLEAAPPDLQARFATTARRLMEREIEAREIAAEIEIEAREIR